MIFFLDTCICIDVLKKNYQPKSIELFKTFRSGNKGIISAITVAELSAGAHRAPNKDAIQKTNDLLTHVTIIDLNDEIAKKGGKIYGDLCNSGKQIEMNDCLIAATALSLNINQIVTRNRDHFNRIDSLSAITPEELVL